MTRWIRACWETLLPVRLAALPRYAGRRFRLGLAIFLSVWSGVASAAPPRVLIVHSFGSAAPPFTTHSIAFESELTEKLGKPVDLDEISLDVARYADSDTQEALVEYIRKRVAKWQPDLVVPIGSPAGVFVAQNRERLFPQTPILYTGMDGRRLPAGALQTNATFVGEDFNLPGFVEDILQVAPATTNIVVVIGASPLEQFWTTAFRREFEPFTNRVSFTWLNDLSFDQMLARVGKLPPHSFIFLVLLMRDATGVTHNADEALKRIHAVANAPVNSIYQHQLGMGIVGGRLYQAELEGVESAHIAIRILHGEPASSIPPKIVGPLPPQYDARELKRWGIGPANLPAASSIKFRQPGFWELYRWPIVGTILFCAVEAGLIIGLLINRARRLQGEAAAALIAEISSKFVNLQPGVVDREIKDAQRRIFELLDLDVSGFWQWSAEASGFFRITHFSRTGEGPQFPERMNSQEYLPWFQQQVLAGRTVVICSTNELPPEAARDRKTFRRFGFKSNLTIPLSVGGEPPIGALGFTTRTERDWPDALIKRLQLVAQIFANALARKRADQALRESEARFRTVANTAPVLIWMSGTDKLCNFFNKSWLDFTGRPLEAELGNGWAEGVHPDDLATCLKTYVESFDARRPFTMEYRLRRHDSEYRWMSDHGVPRYDAAQIFLGYIGSCLDITNRKSVEAELLRQRAELAHVARVSTMGELAASVAHELNQPLGAILANAEAAELFLEQKPPALDDLRAALADIRKDDERASEVIRRMRALLRKHELELQPLDINSLAEEVLQLVSADATLRRISLAADLLPFLPKIAGDRVHLQQVLLNLIINGMDAMHNQPRERRQIQVRTRLGGDGLVELAVIDLGHGIELNKFPRLFEPFYTTKPNGMGMGLSIARTIIKAHQGRIWAENNASNGAVFRILLPALRKQPPGHEVE